jgi:molybdopterin/thiamine biosynthesis adenylyltransferase
MILKIRDSIEVYEDNEGNYIFFFVGSRQYKKFSVDYLIKDLISILSKEECERESIISKLSEVYNPNKIDLALEALQGQKIITSYNKKDIESTQEKQFFFVDEFTRDYEETYNVMEGLKRKTISIFGLGGIGSWMANGMAQMGIGKLIISDPDTINESNLNRQLFYTLEDVGRFKSEVLAERIKGTFCIPLKKRISNKDQLDDLISVSDFVINCSDEPSVYETSRIIDGYSKKYDIPFCIAGGYNIHNGLIGPIFVPGKTATLEDLLDYQKRNNIFTSLTPIRTQKQSGSLGSIAGAVANIQCGEIFKQLTGIGQPKYNHFGEFNFLESKLEWFNFSKTP